jgi:hypothetical protein
LSKPLATKQSLSWAERWLAIQSLFLLQTISLGLRWLGFRPIYTLLRRFSPALPPTTDPQEANFTQAIHLGAVVQLANQRFPALHVTCLPESLVVWWLLAKKGITADLRLGIRNQEGRLDGHAWVEVNHQVVSGDPDLPDDFLPLDLIPQ